MNYEAHFLLFLIMLLVSGCVDNQINPLEEDSGVFSFYGTVEVGKSSNIVRVKDLNDAFLADSAEFNGTITFTDLETGERTAPIDSVVQFSAGFTHNFIIDQEIKPNTSYLLEAVRADGLTAESIANTPAITGVFLLPVQDSFNCEQDITFRFENVVSPEFIDLLVVAIHENERKSSDMRFFLQEFRRLDNEDTIEITLSPHNLLVEVFPTENLLNNPTLDPFTVDPVVGCGQLDSNQMEIVYTHYGREWATARPIIRGLIDFDSGDVANGLGIFGGFYRNTINFTINQ